MSQIHASTYTQHQRIMRNIERVSNDVNNQNQRIAAGQKALHWSDLRPYDTTLLQELDSKISQCESDLGFFKDLEIQANVIMTLLDNVLHSINELNGTIMQAQNSVTGRYIPLQKIANSHLEDLELLLNSTYNGNYIFSGTKANIPPVQNLARVSNLTFELKYTNAYYYGNDVGHFVNAGDESFQKIIGSLNLMKEENIAGPIFDRILDWLQDASKAVEESITIISYEIHDLRDKYNATLEKKVFLESEKSKLIGLDFPTAVMELQNSLLQLNATFKSTVDARVSILDYIN